MKRVESRGESTLSNYQRSAYIKEKWRDAMHRVYARAKGRPMNPFAAALLRVRRRQKNETKAMVAVSSGHQPKSAISC